MASSIYLRLQGDLKQAMRDHDEVKKDTIRLIIAACRLESVSHDGELNDDDLHGILAREKKNRQQSMEEYRLGGREDLSKREALEMQVISAYLPVQLSPDAIESQVKAAITASGASSLKDMGKVMGTLNASLKGKADMKAVSEKVKQLLS
ncbi:hypothetical protein AUK40_02345 [Candidatus Wirthbacteria bacterium CG2_30_54_11]|uniref:Glutamyl-tRNA amidotransferase n=1 Tax=Candidatus Wirthbacteria bacterium CG2_30_54_11 TaxID=1817892 RepID=A0A1J5J306_9BACT|nr:MAG: hypothetical protein AUK40_02345 [Candidatus Wirthbacteria bacterium CG2_30_54_11]